MLRCAGCFRDSSHIGSRPGPGAPGQSRAWTPEALVSFCALANCADGGGPVAGLLADANGNLFGTTE